MDRLTHLPVIQAGILAASPYGVDLNLFPPAYLPGCQACRPGGSQAEDGAKARPR